MCVEQWLLNIVESGYYTVKDWQNWADNVIMNSESPDSWICEVSLAGNIGEIYSIMFNEFGNVVSRDWNVMVGYRYMMYREGRITLDDLLYELTDEHDMIAEYSDLPHKRLWKIYCDLFQTEDGWLDDIEIKEIPNELDEILQLYFEKGVNEKNKFESYMNGGKNE